MFLAAIQRLDLIAQRDMLLTIIAWLILLTLGLALYISQAPPYEWKGWDWKRPTSPEMCKLHMRPRSQCKPEEHDE